MGGGSKQIKHYVQSLKSSSSPACSSLIKLLIPISKVWALAFFWTGKEGDSVESSG